jgi:hypothetical protein
MLEIYFSTAKMLGHLRSGPSGPYLDGLAAALERQGYRPATAVRYLRAAAHVGHIMVERGGSLGYIDLSAFSEHLRTCRCPRAKGGRRNHHTIYGARHFRRHLVESGVCLPADRPRHMSSRSWSPTSKRGCASIAGRPRPPSGSTLATPSAC